MLTDQCGCREGHNLLGAGCGRAAQPAERIGVIPAAPQRLPAGAVTCDHAHGLCDFGDAAAGVGLDHVARLLEPVLVAHELGGKVVLGDLQACSRVARCVSRQ